MGFFTLILFTFAIATGVYIGNNRNLYEKIVRTLKSVSINLLVVVGIIFILLWLITSWNQIVDLPLVKNNQLTQIVLAIIAIPIISKEVHKNIKNEGIRNFINHHLRVAMLTIFVAVIVMIISVLVSFLFLSRR